MKVQGLIKISEFLDSHIVSNEIFEQNETIRFHTGTDELAEIEFDMTGGICRPKNIDVNGYICIFNYNNGHNETSPKRYFAWNCIYSTLKEAMNVPETYCVVQVCETSSSVLSRQMSAKPLW